MINFFLNIQNILLFLIVVFIAAFTQGVTGFGFGIIFMCFVPYILGFKVSVGISTVLSLIQCIAILVRIKGKLNIRKTLITTISFVLFQVIGTSLLFSVSNYVLKMALGIALIIFAVLFVVNEYSKWRIKLNNINSIIIGAFSGIIGGMLGIGGPPIVFYYNSVFEDKNDYNINTQATFAIANLVMLGLHIYHGNINVTSLKYSGLALIVLFISTLFGLKVFRKISKSALTKIIIIFLFTIGIMKLVF